MNNYVNIYTEAVPNPNSLKFVVNSMLTSPNSAGRDYAKADETTDSPLAEELFKYEFTKRIFIAKNFITLTKPNGIEWDEITPIVRNFLKNYLEEGSPIFSDDASTNSEINPDDSEVVKKIKGILDEYVRPAIEGDGGAITFHSFDEEKGIVQVNLEGACSGCPSSTITLKAGIENLLKRMLPNQITEVVAQGI